MPKFQVKILSPGPKIIPLIKSLRLVADLGLGDAKHISDFLRTSTPCVLVSGVDREVADHAAGLLRDAGAEAIVEESSFDAPMLLCPEANQKYRWHWLSGPTPVPDPA
jgi:Ribosomal protein L7/L12 C-terminal domain